MKFSFSILSLLALATSSEAVSFSLAGNAFVDSKLPDCFVLTPDANNKQGAVWSTTMVDLTKSFEIETKFYVGDKDRGADGVALVFRSQGTAELGGTGERKGYFEIAKALAIEVDTYKNSQDPNKDFVQIAYTGASGVSKTSDLTSIKRENFNGNIEDGEEHRMKVEYKSGKNKFVVSIDGKEVLSTVLSKSLSEYVGAENAYFGYTAATGGSTNRQYVCPIEDGIVVAAGDPHFKTWTGEKYDFHGVCDLVLLQNAKLDNGDSLDIHIRTQKTRAWSYIDTAAVRVGDDVLEVKGGKDENRFWVNKQQQHDVDNILLSGRPVTFTQLTDKSRQFQIDIGSGASITIKTWNAMVSVIINGNSGRFFRDSRGLMGAYPSGDKLARDNATEIHDLNVFGQEWQVLPTDPDLFHVIDGPHYPAKCEIPATSQMRRRLGESIVSKRDAELACARVNADDFDICVFDVMATNDKESAGAY
jgi:hypothetical protein